MQSPNQATSIKAVARRRLLRGSFSLPAVLAVHNGSALAARSNQFRCIANQTPVGGGAAPGLTDTTANWVRVTRYRFVSGTVTTYWVKVLDLTAIATASGLTYSGGAGAQSSDENGVGNTTFWRLWSIAGTAAPILGSVLTADGSAAVLFKSTTAGTPAVTSYSVQSFVKEGQISAGPSKGASTHSCWTSIR